MKISNNKLKRSGIIIGMVTAVSSCAISAVVGIKDYFNKKKVYDKAIDVMDKKSKEDLANDTLKPETAEVVQAIEKM